MMSCCKVTTRPDSATCQRVGEAASGRTLQDTTATNQSCSCEFDEVRGQCRASSITSKSRAKTDLEAHEALAAVWDGIQFSQCPNRLHPNVAVVVGSIPQPQPFQVCQTPARAYWHEVRQNAHHIMYRATAALQTQLQLCNMA